MKTKTIIFLILLFVSINAIVYALTETNTSQRIQLVLNKNLNLLETHYKILLHTQKITSMTLYDATTKNKKVMNILAQAPTATKEQRFDLRVKLQKLLAIGYERAKMKGVLQYHFVLPNNESFLRMHKPSKYGDDLTEVRDDFRLVNKTKKTIRSFTQGKTAHGFRNTFPLFDNGVHIGAMEVSFSSDSFQYILTNISNIHTHFLVSKKIFDTNTWQRDDLVLKYSVSAENKDYMITLNESHTQEKCIYSNKVKLAPVKDEITKKMLLGDSFTLYTTHNSKVDTFSFMPIGNLKNEHVAWLVAYEPSPIVEMALKNALFIRIIAFIVSLVFIYFLAKQIYSNYKESEKSKLLNSILDKMDNIVFITDFKTISFFNDNFKTLLNIDHIDDFNHNADHNLLDMFVEVEGYLHKNLLEKDEDFISLITRMTEDKRIVSILDKHFEPKAFKISISQTATSNDFLVTLTDVTKLKEKQVQAEKKAYTDGLTKVFNRNKFDEIFKQKIAQVKRYNHSFAIAIIDIDKFKLFNDKHGHLVGDEVLIMMAQCVNRNIRDTDTFARWGGEEFVILFEETDAKIAKIVSLKIKDKIEALSHPVAGGITASFGITQYQKGDSIKSIFQRCDNALYLAKENGRNRVEVL